MGGPRLPRGWFRPCKVAAAHAQSPIPSCICKASMEERGGRQKKKRQTKVLGTGCMGETRHGLEISSLVFLGQGPGYLGLQPAHSRKEQPATSNRRQFIGCQRRQPSASLSAGGSPPQLTALCSYIAC